MGEEASESMEVIPVTTIANRASSQVRKERSLVQHDSLASVSSESDTRKFILGIFKYSTIWKKFSGDN